MRRFPNYQPSTALRQAIEALNAARKNRAAAETDRPGQGQGGPDALTTTPGQEGTSTGQGQAPTDALVSGRDSGETDDA